MRSPCSDECDAVDTAGYIREKAVDAHVAQSGFLSIEPEVIRCVKQMRWRGVRVRPRQQQIGIAVAIGVAGATRQFRITERHQFRDRRNAAILHADLFQMRAILLRTTLRNQSTLPVVRRNTAPAVDRSGAIQDQLLHRSSVAISRSTFFKKRARHNSLPVFLV